MTREICEYCKSALRGDYQKGLRECVNLCVCERKKERKKGTISKLLKYFNLALVVFIIDYKNCPEAWQLL